MSGRDPADYAWWLASRAAGLTALALMTATVLAGLVMAGGLPLTRPGLKRAVLAVHEHTALVALVAVAAHGVTLLGDPWLHLGPAGLAVPFVMDYRPAWTGIGILGGWLAATLSLTYYARRRIGARRWRAVHRFILVAWLLAVVHTLGAGTDAGQAWLRWPLAAAVMLAALLGARRLGPPAGAQTGRLPVGAARRA